MKGKEKRKPGININPGVLKIVMLLLAIALLIAGLYYSEVMNKPVQAPVKPGNLVRMKVQTPPAPVPPEAAVKPSPDTSSAPQGASATSVNSAAGKSEPAVPVPPDRPFAIKVSYTQDFRIAEDAVDALKAQGHEAYSTRVDLKEKGIWYRIFIGPFASENGARQYIRDKNMAAVYPGWMIYKETEIVARGYGKK